MSARTSLYRPAFEDALRIFARVSEDMKRAGHAAPILVGGGAVALHADADLDYMERRIRHESAGDYGVADLKR